jgi:hypothetical protein
VRDGLGVPALVEHADRNHALHLRYRGGDSSLSLSDAGSPATPQCDFGIS